MQHVAAVAAPLDSYSSTNTKSHKMLCLPPLHYPVVLNPRIYPNLHIQFTHAPRTPHIC